MVKTELGSEEEHALTSICNTGPCTCMIIHIHVTIQSVLENVRIQVRVYAAE